MSDFEPAMTRLPFQSHLRQEVGDGAKITPLPASADDHNQAFFEAASICISLPNQEISVIRFPNRRVEPALSPAAGRQERNAIVAF
jgi:hypothetical protein